MRLDKYLSHMGFGTRNDVKDVYKRQGTHHLNDECLIYSTKHFTNKVSFSFNLKLNSSAR